MTERFNYQHLKRAGFIISAFAVPTRLNAAISDLSLQIQTTWTQTTKGQVATYQLNLSQLPTSIGTLTDVEFGIASEYQVGASVAVSGGLEIQGIYNYSWLWGYDTAFQLSGPGLTASASNTFSYNDYPPNQTSLNYSASMTGPVQTVSGQNSLAPNSSSLASYVGEGTVSLAFTSTVSSPPPLYYPGGFFFQNFPTYNSASIFGAAISNLVIQYTYTPAIPTNLIWNNFGASASPSDGMTWDTTNFNWNNGSGVVTYDNVTNAGPGDNVTFNDTNNGHYAVIISGTVSPNSTTFNNNAGNYTIAGSNSSSGISGAGSLVKFGTGNVTLSSKNTYTGGTIVNAGSLTLASATAYPADTGLMVAQAASVTIANHGTNAIFVLYLSSLVDDGLLDVTNNAMIIHNGSISALTGQIDQAFNNGAWNGINTSTGTITSSLAASDTTSLTAVGIATGFTNFEGQTVDPTDVLIKFTYYGDANLDGHVDGSDYSRIDNGYLLRLTGWDNGDFNYDGTVDGSDYTLIDNAFNTQGAIIQSEIVPQWAATTALIVSTGDSSVIPESTTLNIFNVVVAGLLIRRPRRSRTEVNALPSS